MLYFLRIFTFRLSARVMSYAEKHHKLWTDTPDLCKDYAGVLREIVNRLKCKGDETPAGEILPFISLTTCLVIMKSMYPFPS